MKGSVQAASGISAILLPPAPTGALALFPIVNYPNMLIVQIKAPYLIYNPLTDWKIKHV